MTAPLHQPLDTGPRDSPVSRRQYVDRALALYAASPETVGHVRASDRRLAGQLFDSGVPFAVVRAAFVVAAVRRRCRPPDTEALEPIRSLHYLRPVIQEILRRPLDPLYLDHLEHKLATLVARRTQTTDDDVG